MKRKEIIAKIREVLAKNKVKKAYLFGSFARKERKYKDVDIAIVPPDGRFSLFDLIGLQIEISESIGVKSDVGTLDSIKPAVLPYVKKNLIRMI